MIILGFKTKNHEQSDLRVNTIHMHDTYSCIHMLIQFRGTGGKFRKLCIITR